MCDFKEFYERKAAFSGAKVPQVLKQFDIRTPFQGESEIHVVFDARDSKGQVLTVLLNRKGVRPTVPSWDSPSV